MEKRRVFVDMDGTLAEYRAVEDLDRLLEKDYFLTLAPNPTVCAAVRDLLYGEVGEDVEVFVLSAYLPQNPFALCEKNEWLDVFFGPDLIDQAHRVFMPCGACKADYVPGGIRPTDILLDDYSKNLWEWHRAGGVGLKLLNGINATRGTWQQARLSMRRDAREMATAIYRMAWGQAIPCDERFVVEAKERALPFVAAHTETLAATFGSACGFSSDALRVRAS